VVAELNGTVIARSNWKTTALKTQDRLELLSFVGGG
jgi:thiamine biosynthesis protein ThiS